MKFESISLKLLFVLPVFLKVSCLDNCNSSYGINAIITTGSVTFLKGNLQCSLNSTFNTTITATDITVSGLTAGNVYSFQFNCTGCSTICYTVATEPDVIRNLSVSGVTTSSVSLSWSSPVGSHSFYRVRWNGTQRDVQAASITLNNLTAATLYIFNITAIAMDNQTEGYYNCILQNTKPAPVSNLSVTNVTTSSVTLNWVPADGNITSYTVQWNGSSMVINQTVGSSITTSVSGLTPGTQYTFGVAAMSGVAIGDAVWLNQSTRPGKPSNIVATNQGNSSLSISWNSPQGGVSGFAVQIASSQLNFTKNCSVSTNSTTLSQLYAGITYNVTVTSVSGNFKNMSDTVQFATNPNPPGAISTDNKTNSSLSLRWSMPLMDSSVQFNYSITYTSSQANHTQIVPSTQNQIQLSGLSSGTQYNVSVETVGVQNLRSDVVTQSIYTYPNPVQNLTGNEMSTTWIKLTWGNPVGFQPYYTYTVQVSNSTGPIRSLPAQTTNINVTGLQPGTKYNITVMSATPGNTFGPPQVTLCQTKPMPVDGLSATSVSSTEVRLTWTGQSYGNSTSFYLVSVSQTNFSVNTTNSSVVISDLSPGSNYTFTVITVVNTVQSVPATVFCFTVPDKATNIKAVGTTTGLTVTWDRPKGTVTSYTVTVSSSNNSNGSSTNTNQTVFNTSAVFTGLKPGQIYSIVVTTQSGPINVDSDVVRNATLPNPPTGLTFYGLSTTSINITWVKPSNMSLGSYNFTVYYGANVASTSDTWICLGNLIPGTWYNVSVMTVGPMLYLSTADTISGCTSLAPVTQLQAVEITTSNVTLAWEAPGSEKVYNYHITGSNLNLTVNSTFANIGGLQSGTSYVFNVTALTNCALSDAVPISLFTRPEKVTPAVSNRGTNDSITVMWNSPQGNVERYMVNITGNQEGTLMQELNSSSQSYVLANLIAGRTYSVIVTTISGPFSEPSYPVSNATYPNKPGTIMVTGKTTSSISLVWSDAPDIDYNTSFYVVEWMPAESSNALNASVNSTVLHSLASGTSYNISVTTVGPMGYKSDSAKVQLVTTQPMEVQSLEINNISAEWALLKWNKPSDFKSGYQYTVRAAYSTGNVISETVTGTVHQVNGLWPGTAYNFSVTVLTSDGTEGSPVLKINCTDEAPVMNLRCQGPNLTSAILVLTWTSPAGLFTTLDLKVAGQPVDSVGACDSVCNRTIANLSYYTDYTVSLTTRGCGRSSQAVELPCRTGITVPPVPDTQAYVQVTNPAYDSFTLNLSPELFNDSAGPVVSYGVLVTSDLSGVTSQSSSSLMKYLTITYDDWNAGRQSTYLAVLNWYSGTARSEENTVVTIGDNTGWQNYINGPLKAKGSYSFAVVLFTHLEVKDGYLDSSTSYVSISPFYQFPINLPQNPVVLASISGAVLSIVIISIIVIIAAVIFKRRKKHSNHSDVPIESLRAKVSVAITVENFEEYFRKQHANSNCGFAEEFENLKTVGVAQPKNSALALENKGKNRYNNVLPYDPSRVKLSVHGNPFDDYINANYMPGYNSKKEFIAAQGPLPSTVSDFWRMIWEKNVRSLVMLTRCNEQGRVKCEQYWPSGTKQFNNISVTTTSEIVLDDWTIRDFDVKNLKTAENRYLRHFHFTAWPDHGVPETTELLISFRHLVREHMEEFSRHSPTVVHCSAGVGRTGTFIAIDRLIFQIEQENKVDVYGIVHDLRMHRPLMVQTEDQYVFLNQCALDFIRSRTGTNVDLIYQNTAALTIYENFEAMKKLKNGYHLA